MQHILTIIGFISFSLCFAEVSYQTRYTELQQGTSYHNRSFPEIAALTEDYPALAFFISMKPTPTQHELVETLAILQNKLLVEEENLNNAPAPDVINIAQVTSWITEKKDHIRNIKNMIYTIKRLIKQ